MFEEATFLRDIQANPADAIVKLVYADWLEDREESEKAEYVRLVADKGFSHSWQAGHASQGLPRPWLDLFHNHVPLWDPPTLFGLGRLNGLLTAFALCSDHSSDIVYDFRAALLPRRNPLQTMADDWYGSDCQPVRLEQLSDWQTDLRQALREELFRELGSVRSSLGTRLALQRSSDRDGILEEVVRWIAAVITSTAGWRVHITEKRWYAIQWTDLILEAPDRVLFLHFSFSD